jgi:hypothetical protein
MLRGLTLYFAIKPNNNDSTITNTSGVNPESERREGLILIHDELEANTLRRGIRFDELALIDAHRLAFD